MFAFQLTKDYITQHIAPSSECTLHSIVLQQLTIYKSSQMTPEPDYVDNSNNLSNHNQEQNNEELVEQDQQEADEEEDVEDEEGINI